jgi:RHS repeat-associated protein
VTVRVGYQFTGPAANRYVRLYRNGQAFHTFSLVPDNSGVVTLTQNIGCSFPTGNYTFSAVAIACLVESSEVAAAPVFINTTPTVSLSALVFNADKTQATAEINYAFPYVSSGTLETRRDSGSWSGGLDYPQNIGWQGSFPVTYHLSCLARGTHSIQVQAIACVHQSDPEFRSTAPPQEFAVDPVQITSLTATGPDPAGKITATIGYEFETIAADAQNFRQIDLFFDGARVGGVSTLTNSASPSVTFTKACLSEGLHTLRAVGVACDRPADPLFRHEMTTTIVTPVPKGSVSVSALYNPETGKIDLQGSYELPAGATSAQLVITRLPQADHRGDVLSASTLKNESVTAQSGTFSFSVSRPTSPSDGSFLSATEVKFVARLNTCNTVAEATATAKCPCEAASKNPVYYTDGNMRYVDTDALAPLFDSLRLTRTYDSNHDVLGTFGRGWTSIFDSRLSVVTGIAGGDVISISSPDGNTVAFARRGGVYTQLWPSDGSSQASMALATGMYLYRPTGSNVTHLFRESDGRFAGFRDGSGREVTIGRDAAGLPTTVTDTWTGAVWTITTDPVKYRITEIAAGGLIWRYLYDANDNLYRVTLHNYTWRTYEYVNNKMTLARDESGNFIESHTYDAKGRAIDSTGPDDEIANIEHRAPGTTSQKLVTRVTLKSGATTDFILKPVGGAWRPAQILGSCSSCGSRDATYVYDSGGHVVREQHADGYVTVHAYTAGKRTLTAGPYRPAACDPETVCRLTSEALAETTLEATASTATTTFEYDDLLWPDRITATSRASVLSGEQRQTFTYDPLTGETLQSSISGSTKRLDGTVVSQTRTTTTTLYNGGEGAAFAPGGSFMTPWESLPQPRLRKSIDGPMTGAADTTLFVYYPVDPSVLPALLRGRLAATRNPAGHVVRYEDYDQFGNVRRVVDQNGVVTERTFDTMGRLLTVTTKGVAGCDAALDPLCSLNLTTKTVYTAGGLLESEHRPSGGVVKYTYDGRGRVVTISRGPSLTDLRERVEHTYDAATAKKSSERLLAFEGGAWIEKKSESYGYDADGELVTITHGDGTTIGYAYDAAGRIASVRDENHSVPNTTYAYDTAGRMKTVMQTLVGARGGAVATEYTYDTHGNLVSVKDPNGNVTRYVYDDFGVVVSQESPVTGQTSYEYDTAGNITATKDANGVTTVRAYDVLNRLTQASSSAAGAPAETVTWTYDGSGSFTIGRVTRMTDPTGATSYTYDRRGFLLKEVKTIDQSSYTTTFQYDHDGNRSRIVYPGTGRVVTYTFDYAGRPATASAGSTPLVSSAKYLPFGPLTQIVFGNGATRSMTFDARYRPLTNKLATAATTIASYAYEHDNAGNVTAMTDITDSSYNRTFGYDDLNRLTSANTGSSLWGVATYAYDAMGNMTAAPGRTFTYAGTKPQLQTVTAGTSTNEVRYDFAGNETLVGGASYTYSPRNHLATTGKYSFGYDGRGIRTATFMSEFCPNSVAPAALGFSETGGSRSVAVTAVTDCAWTISSAAPWIAVSIPNGAGSATVSVTVQRNTQPASRTAVVKVNETEITVFQQGTTNATNANDFFADGTSDIIARNALTGAVKVLQTDGQTILGSSDAFAETGTFGRTLVTGDVNGDGKSDVLERNGRTGELVVRIMNGGSVLSSSVITTGSNYVKVAGMADVTGDGKAEIITRNESSGAVHEWTRGADGGWSSTEILTEADRQWTIAALADFTADGRADLLWRNARTGAVQIQTRASAVAFSSTRTTIFTDAETWWYVLGAADVDGDGYADVLSYSPRSGQVKVRRMSQTTILATWTLAGKTEFRWTIAQIGDFNGDGRADLLWRDGNTGALEIQLIDGSSVLRTSLLSLTIDVDSKIASSVTAYGAQGNSRPDLGGDGKSDILWRKTAAEGYVSLWEMDGRSTAATWTMFSVADQNWQIKAAADFNGDRKDDLIFYNASTGSVLLDEMNGPSVAAASQVASLPPGWNITAAGSFDGDRAADIVLINSQTQEVRMWRMTGKNIDFDAHVGVLENGLWKLTGIADFNGDGRMDLLFMHPDGRVGIWWMEGSTIFLGRMIAQVNPASGAEIQRVGDFTGDGRADIVWREKPSGYLWLWEIPYDRTPVESRFDQRVTDNQWQIQSTPSDYNGDGRQELLWRHTTTGDLAMWELRGTSLVNGNTFAALATFWAVPAIDPDGKTVYGSSVPPTVTALASRAPWWTPIAGAPPFWSVQPGRPSIALPPHGMPPPWAPAHGLTEPQHVPVPNPIPWWEPTPPDDGTSTYRQTQRRTLWATLLQRFRQDDQRVPLTLSVTHEPLTVETLGTPSTILLRRYSLYTPELQLMAETLSTTAATPAIAHEYIWFGGQPVAQITSSTGAISFYFNDHLETPILQTDATATVVWRAEYDPYGKVVQYRAAAAKHQPLRFPGQENDGTSDTSYNVFRWYRPAAGRYTQADPLGVVPTPLGVQHLYGYAEANAVSRVDPLGLYSIDKNCADTCGPDNVTSCFGNPQTINCVKSLMEQVKQKVFFDSHCRKALTAAGKWQQVAGSLMPSSLYPKITCNKADCVGSEPKFYPVTKTIPMCKWFFAYAEPAGAQSMLHEVLHYNGVHHDETEKNILTSCFPGFNP